MASNVQSTNNNRNFPKGSYRAYTSLLKQYAGSSSTTGNATTKTASPPPPPPPPKPETKPANSSAIPFPPPLPSSQPPTSSITSNGQTAKPIPKPELNLETLLALNSEEMELLDIKVLRAFLEVLKQGEHKEKKVGDVIEVVDSNNNQASLGTSALEENAEEEEEDIETSKQNLIQSLKEQLLRFRRGDA